MGRPCPLNLTNGRDGSPTPYPAFPSRHSADAHGTLAAHCMLWCMLSPSAAHTAAPQHASGAGFTAASLTRPRSHPSFQNNLFPLLMLLLLSLSSLLQVEAQFNNLLDRCNEFREEMGAAADALSLGRAMELLSARAAPPHTDGP